MQRSKPLLEKRGAPTIRAIGGATASTVEQNRALRSLAEPTLHGGGRVGFATASPEIVEVGNPSLLRCVPRSTTNKHRVRGLDTPYAERVAARDVKCGGGSRFGVDDICEPVVVLRRPMRLVNHRAANTASGHCLVSLTDAGFAGETEDRGRHHVRVARVGGDDDKENASRSGSAGLVAFEAMYMHNGGSQALDRGHDIESELGAEKPLPMKRRKSDDGERNKKAKLEKERGCESDSGLPPGQHHHHHHHKKAAKVGEDQEESRSTDGANVHGICTLKEGSLKLKISLHRPHAATTPEADGALAPKPPSGDKFPQDHSQPGSPLALARYNYPDTAATQGLNLVPGCSVKVKCSRDNLSADSAGSNLSTGQHLSQDTRTIRTMSRKNLSPGHYVPYPVVQNRRRLIQDTSKMKKKVRNVEPPHEPEPRARANPSHQQHTFHHVQVTVGQNGGRGIVNHSSILDHPSVHSRMFAGPQIPTGSNSVGPTGQNLMAPLDVSKGAQGATGGALKQRPGKSRAPGPSQEHQPLDLSKPAGKQDAPPFKPPSKVGPAPELHYIPPIGVLYMKPKSRQRLDGIVQKLWAKQSGVAEMAQFK